LREIGDRTSLGLLLCARAECAWRAGARWDAEVALASADELARAVGAGQGTELHDALLRVRRLFEAVAPSAPGDPTPGN
jgi:hypothetical protein